MKKNYKKIVIPVIAVGAVGAVAIGSRFLLKGNEKDIKVGEITSNAIDSMNSAICSAINSLCDYERGSGDGSNVAVNNGSLNADDSFGWMSKEEFAAATNLTGEKLDEYYSYYIEGKDGGDTPVQAYDAIVNIIVDNGDAVLPTEVTSDSTSNTDVADNTKPGNTGNNNSGGNGNSGNSNGGSSSSSNVENDSQNQNDNVMTPEEAEAALNAMNGGSLDDLGYTPLTEEQQQAEEEAWANMNGY